MPATERGWLPDFVYRACHFETNTAFFADDAGLITRFSQAPEDLQSAQRLPHRAILPGLVNVHSHSFQRAIRARTEHRTQAQRDTFWTWREAMYHAATALSPEDIYHVARMAFLEMLTAGITAVGEFHYLHHQPNGTPYDDPNLLAKLVLRAARETGLRIALLRTAYVRAGFHQPPNRGQCRFITPHAEDFIRHTEALRACATPLQSVGVAPHSVRAVPLQYLLEVTGYARALGMKIHMHVSEQPAEIAACQAEYGARPVELLHRHRILGPDFTAIHAIHIDQREIAQLAATGARIGACPTTERNLGDGIPPAREWSAAPVPTCFGTDSNAQIDLFEDARQLEYHQRLKHLERAVFTAPHLFTSATQTGADSIGTPGSTLTPGQPADFFTVDLNHLSIAGADPASLLTHIVFAADRAAIRDVYVAGRRVIEDGCHPLHHEIVANFQTVQSKLWK